MQKLSRMFVQSLLVVGVGCEGISGTQPNAGDLRNPEGALSRNTAEVAVGNAAYVVTGPHEYMSAGSVSLSGNGEAVVSLSGLPIGDNYVIDATALAEDGQTPCIGSETFNVTNASVAVVLAIPLDCVPKGAVAIGATFNICPLIDGLSAMPTSLAVGGVATLSLTAHDTDNGPAPMAFSWSVNGVRATLQTPSSLKFTCTSVGQFTITASVSDGDPNFSCMANSSVKVNCE